MLEKERPQQPAWKTVTLMAPSRDDFCSAIPDLEASIGNQRQEGQHVSPSDLILLAGKVLAATTRAVDPAICC